MDIGIQKYIAFVKTAECGSFTKAAEALNYSQSGISRMINDLEKELNIVLMERGRAGVRLTSDGLRLYNSAKKLCIEYENFRMEAESLKGLDSGIIRIGTFSSVATHWLPNIIKEFQKDYPNIKYELLMGDYNEIEKWIHEGRVDCGFLCLPTSPEFDVIFLEKDELLAVLPPDHRLAESDKFPVSEISNEPFMLLEKGTRSEITQFLQKNNLKPNVHFTTWDDYAIMSMVESGLGISILPHLILKRVPYNIVTKPLDVPAYRSIGLALRSRKTASLAAKRFLDYLRFR